MRFFKTAAMRCLFTAVALWGGLTFLCAHAQQTREVKPADWSPSIRLVIPDIKLCPGQTYDLPVYIEVDEPIQIRDFQVAFRFPDYAVVEPTGGVTNIHADLRSGSQSSYNEQPVKNLPDHVFTFSWIGNGRYFEPESGDILFRFVIRSHEAAEGVIDLVAGDKYPTADDYSHFVVMGAANKGTVFPSFDTAYARPAAPPEVRVLPDTTICVNTEARLWAEGGVEYYWEDVSPVENAYRPSMADPYERNPLFRPQDPGYYTYRVKITAQTGCYAYATGQYLVLDNHLNLDVPQDTMVDAGGQALLNATVYGGYPPYTLSWEPASLVETPLMTDLSATQAGGRVSVKNVSKPLQRPQWFTVQVKDHYCTWAKRQSVNVAGSEIEGAISMNPSFFCVGDNVNETVDLSVEARGGYGRYSYYWTAENLEPDRKAPEFENDVNGPTARLRFFARCVVAVQVSDRTTRKTMRFTDTLQFKERLLATVTIDDLNGASSCENTEMTFVARTANAGENPQYKWRINGKEAGVSEDSVFKTYRLRRGDRLDCELRSSQECVANPVVEAPTVTPNVVTPGYMVLHTGFGADDINTACGEAVSLSLVHRYTGSRFRLRWFRNDEELVYDQFVTNEESDEVQTLTTDVTMPRGGYYDYYRATVSESDRACLLDDSLVTMAMYPRLEPKRAAQAGSVYVHPDDAAGVCTGRSFMVYARDPRYLPSQFRLVWYVKKPGGAPVAKGYYATSDFADNAAYGRNLGTSAEFAAADAYYRTQNWILKGFPVSLSTAVDAVAGDSVYYRLETKSVGCAPAVDVVSRCFVVKTEPTVNAAPSTDFATAMRITDYCEGATARFYPVFPSSDEVRYTWFVGGEQISGIYPDRISGDTLKTRIYNGLEIKLQAYNSQKCLSLDIPRTTETAMTVKDMYDGFMTVAAKDTMVCGDDSVSLWAVGVAYKGIGRPNAPETGGVPEWLSDYEGKIKVEWAENHADAVAGRFIGTGIRFDVAVDSARFGDRSGDLYKDSAVVGTQKFFARLTSANGCTGYDSVNVTVAYRRRPTVRVVPESAFPWCEGNTDGKRFRLEGTFWGENPVFAMWATHPSGNFEDWVVQKDPVWTYNPSLFHKDRPIIGGVSGSMLTCTEKEVYSDTVYLEIREKPEAWILRGDRTVCQGDELTVVGYGCTRSEYNRLLAMGYTEDEMMEALSDEYEFAWLDETSGEVVSESRILVVRPERSTRYTLVVRDKAHRCAEATATVSVRVALKTGVDIVFTDVATGKEMPFSICEGGDSVEFYCRVIPRPAAGPHAYLGFTVVDIATGKEKDQWFQYDMNDLPPVKFYPGERLVYYCVHDTLSCDGSDYAMDSVDLGVGRPASSLFRAEPDTMLCDGEPARLSLGGAVRNPSDLSDGAPSLKTYLEACGIPEASDITGRPMVYWWPAADLDDRYSFTPLASPDKNHIYHVWGYNEYGCIQTDSVRVERFDGSDVTFKLVLRAADTLLCDTDSLSFSLDRYESSILTMFDSLVWRRVRASGPKGAGPAAPEVLAVNTDRIRVDVAHGDTVYVDGFVKGDGLCEAISAAWYTSNKVGVRSYRRPSVLLSKVDAEACVDSTFELRAHVEEGALLHWTFGLENGGGVGAVKPQYEILDGGRPTPFMAWAKLRTYGSFTAVVASYYDSSCVACDSIPVDVKQDIDTLRIVLSDVPPICGDGLAEIEVARVDKAENWRWWLNGLPMLASDVTDDNGQGVSVLGSRMERIYGRFDDGDVIMAEARTSGRCVYRGLAESNTIRIKRSENPVWHWLEPVDTLGTDGVASVTGCAGDPLALRLLVERGGGLQAVWTEDGSVTEKTFVLEEETAKGEIYGLQVAYPAFSQAEESGMGRLAVLRIGLGYENCSAVDSVRVIGRPYEPVNIEIVASAASVCEGEEVVFRLNLLESADSVVWYVNDEPVFSGRLPAAVEYVYRPAAGDRVYAEAYNASGACVVNNGKRSNELRVEVLSGDLTAGPVEAALTASADSVCGAGAPTYTVSGRGFDSVYWYANGLLSAVTDLLGDVTSAPEVRTAAWKRVPRPAAEGADSVYAVAVRRERLCAVRDSNRTAAVSVYRREMPEVRIAPRDTAVTPGDDLALQASGATAYVWWTDADDGIAGKEAAFTLTAADDTVLVYVMGYEPAYGPDSLAGGGRTPAPDAYGDFGCRAYDSVCVRPGAERRDGPVVYVPNAVLRNSARPADRVFKVFGEGIVAVAMRIYNHGGDLIFERTGEDPVWKPGDVTAGNYTYRLVITLESGEAVRKSGWISVLD